MKFKKLLVPGAIALLVMAALGFSFSRSLANTGNANASQQVSVSRQAQDCSAEQFDGAENETAGETDTDQVENECGDQNEAEDQSGNDANEGASSGNEDTEAAPSGTPALTVEEAKAAALAVHSGTITEVELDQENGKLVYSVAFEGGVDVKVDAMTGAIVATEIGQD